MPVWHPQGKQIAIITTPASILITSTISTSTILMIIPIIAAITVYTRHTSMRRWNAPRYQQRCVLCLPASLLSKSVRLATQLFQAQFHKTRQLPALFVSSLVLPKPSHLHLDLGCSALLMDARPRRIAA